MHPTTPPWLKRLMLACMVVLGLQLCFPVALRASAMANQRVDVIGLGTKDPASKPGVDVDLDVPPLFVLLLVLPEWLDVPARTAPVITAVVIPTLLPVAGFHPAAP